MSKTPYIEYIVVNEDQIIGGSLYASDARSTAREFVKASPGARVRIYRGEETVYSYVAVGDDAPKAAPETAT